MVSRERLHGWLLLAAGVSLTLTGACRNDEAGQRAGSGGAALGGNTALGGKTAASGGAGGSAGAGGTSSTGASTGGAGGSPRLDAAASGGSQASGGGGGGGTRGDAAAGTGGNAAGGTGSTVTGGTGGARDAAASDAKRDGSGADVSGGGGSGSGGGGGNGGNSAIDGGTGLRATYAYGAIVENTGSDCPVPTLVEGSRLTAKVSKLPDPFPRLDGSKMAKRSDWHCRRNEILEQAKKYVHGERPAPEVVTGSVTKTNVSVHVEALGKKIDFAADVVLPSKGQPPYPAVINVGAKSGFGGIVLGESRILDQGVAVIYYDNYKLGVEGTAEQSRGKPNTGLFYDLYGGTHSAGLLMAWSWGASRLVDVLQQSGGAIIDFERLGVTGCSRFGKGAFVIGLYDERIALTIPQEPSTGGDPALRIMDVLSGAERTDYNYNGLNWLSNNFAPFVYSNGSNVVKLPIDTHSMIATFAPRGLLVLENPHQTQMGAPAGHMATVAGAEVYKALGVESNVSYHSAVADTNHCSYKTEYTDLLTRNIARFLKHETAKTGDIAVGSGALKTADWKDWTAPALQDDLPADWVLK